LSRECHTCQVKCDTPSGDILVCRFWLMFWLTALQQGQVDTF
jgi:hypothetical protein